MIKKILVSLIILFGVNQKALSVNFGLKCEINRINANHIVGSLADMPFGEEIGYPKTINKTGWGFLIFSETNKLKIIRFEVGLGFKRANFEQIIYTWAEDIVNQNLHITYTTLPITCKIEANQYVPDILMGFSLNIPFYASFNSKGHYSSNDYKETVDVKNLKIDPTFSVGLGKRFKLSGNLISIEIKYASHMNNVEFKKMGKLSQNEVQAIVGFSML